MICPVFNMVQDCFVKCNKPRQNQTIEEGMIAFKADLVMYNIYLPNQLGEELRCGCDVMLYNISASI